MRLLLDENVPKKLKQDLTVYDVYTVRELRQDGNEDEDMLRFLIDFNIDVFITCDKNLRFQQNLVRYPTPILILDTYTNAYPIIKSVVPQSVEALESSLPAGATLVKPL